MYQAKSLSRSRATCCSTPKRRVHGLADLETLDARVFAVTVNFENNWNLPEQNVIIERSTEPFLEMVKQGNGAISFVNHAFTATCDGKCTPNLEELCAAFVQNLYSELSKQEKSTPKLAKKGIAALSVKHKGRDIDAALMSLPLDRLFINDGDSVQIRCVQAPKQELRRGSFGQDDKTGRCTIC
jgi:hypothetical protein